MQTKLTLKLNDKLISDAKEYAKVSGKSVSQLVSEYFLVLSQQNVDNEVTKVLPPITMKLKGILAKSTVKISEEDYKNYLSEKNS